MNNINNIISEFDNGWIVGLIETKGLFTRNTIKIKRETKKGVKFYRYVNPALYIANTDVSALEAARQILQMGKIIKYGQVFHLQIRRKDELLKIVRFLQGKLKSRRRQQQFELWRQMVLQWKSRAWGHGAAI
jgi:hypothetical protein